MKKQHSLLKRHLKQHMNKRRELDDEFTEFINVINKTFHEYDESLNQLGKSLDISSSELLNANADMRAIFDVLPDVFFRVDNKGIVQNYKVGTETKLQLSTDSVIGQPLATFLPHDVFDILNDLLTLVAEQDIPITIDFSTMVNNDIVYYETRAIPLGQNHILLILRDITKIKLSEIDASQSKTRLEIQNQSLFDIAINPALHRCDLSIAFEEIAITAANTLNIASISIWFFNDVQSVLHCTCRYSASSGPEQYQQHLNAEQYPNFFQGLTAGRAIAATDVQSDSRTQDLLDCYLLPQEISALLAVPIYISGNYVGVIFYEHIGLNRKWATDEQQYAVSMADMVGRVCESDEREKAQRALLESEERFRILAETSGSAIFTFRDKFLYVNPSMRAITGYSKTELLNMRVADIFEKALVDDVEFRLVHELDQSVNYINREVVIDTKEGQQCYLHLTVGFINLNGKLTCIGSAFDITERKLIEEQLRHQAFFDRLTGLPNRALFIDRLEHCLDQAKRDLDYQCAVLFLDLDRFKVVNDSLGHLFGDELLVEVGRRLKSLVRNADTIARLGGDEFTVLIEDARDLKQVLHISDRIQEELGKSFFIHSQEIYITTSIGIAVGDSSYQRPDHVLRDADIALYRAKSNGKACHEIFDSQMHARAHKLLQLEGSLRNAIKEHEFKLFYQPIVSLDTGRTHGFEALIRWQQSDDSIVPPAEFIPLAEESGLIIPLGNWVIQEASTQLQAWQKQYPDFDLTLNINLSSKQFDQDDLIDIINTVIDEKAISSNHFKLELTESMLMNQSHELIDKLNKLKSLGVELFIDDFGTGYSSLNYLHKFPIDALKIDRSFISNIGADGENTEIAQAIISMAHSLGLKVVAEGVENMTQLIQLCSLNCDYAQGYFFSKPVPIEEAESFIDKEWPEVNIDQSSALFRMQTGYRCQ